MEEYKHTEKIINVETKIVNNTIPNNDFIYNIDKSTIIFPNINNYKNDFIYHNDINRITRDIDRYCSKNKIKK
jgi:hypothetical protein